MSETRIRPRFELEEGTVARLELPAVALSLPPRAGPGTLGLVIAGVAVLVLGLALLDVGNFVADQFARGPVLGWLTAAVAVAGFGLIFAAVWRELRGLFGLRHVDRLRAAFADPARAQRAALEWLDQLAEGEALKPAVLATDDPAVIAALLRAGPLASLRARSAALGSAAAASVFAMTAAVPVPSLDALVMAWRGARLVRQVAELYGVRPGVLGMLALLRRVAFGAAGVLATDVAVDTLARAVVSNAAFQRLAGDVAGAGVAARRMVVLARVTAASCSPLDPA